MEVPFGVSLAADGKTLVENKAEHAVGEMVIVAERAARDHVALGPPAPKDAG